MLNTTRAAILAIAIILVCSGWLLMEMRKGDSKQAQTSSGNSGVLRIEMPERVDTSGPFSVLVIMDSQGETVNAVGTYLEFDKQRLEILEMDTKNSFCQFYPENKFDNQTGLISVACGAPNPGFSGQSTIINLKMLPLTTGNARITVLPKSQILLHDGKGTNILQEYPQKELLIVGGI